MNNKIEDFIIQKYKEADSRTRKCMFEYLLDCSDEAALNALAYFLGNIIG